MLEMNFHCDLLMIDPTRLRDIRNDNWRKGARICLALSQLRPTPSDGAETLGILWLMGHDGDTEELRYRNHIRNAGKHRRDILRFFPSWRACFYPPDQKTCAFFRWIARI
jgi:hypothetical protein